MRVINNRYALKREIGRGSSGSVWLARDEALGRGVAIKMVDRQLVETLQASPQIHREARLVARLRSPHIVQVYDLGEEDGRTFIVMELLEGESLDVRLTRHSRMALRVTSRFVTEVAKGLTQIHQAGIVHRDLKPANIFIAREAGRELIKLLDFGVSSLCGQVLDGESARAGAQPMVGTPQYMGPEQFAGGGDYRSDLWSLGVIAFQMVTGACPFSGRNLSELMHQVCHQSWRRPAEGLPPALEMFFERALAKNPDDRFETAAELSLALGQIAEPRAMAVMRVLVVDDEEDMELLMRQRYRKELRAGSIEFCFALNGESGLAELRERDIDVVLTDINMPGMGGLTFIERALELNPIVRVVVVSAYGDMSNIRAAMNKGAFDFIEKPIDFDDLQTTMEKCASHVALLREASRSREENQLMRMLVGHGAADARVREVRSLQGVQPFEREATVVFVDVYTSGDDDAPAMTLFDAIKSQFDLLVPEIVAHDGGVVRFAGGAFFCVFDGERHLHRALAACHAIRERLGWLDIAASNREATRRDVVFGVDTGRVLSASIGPQPLGQVDPAISGSPVAVAHRLCGVAERGELLISDCVRMQIEGDYACEPAYERVLHGRLRPTQVFRVLGRAGGSGRELQRLEDALPATVPLISDN